MDISLVKQVILEELAHATEKILGRLEEEVWSPSSANENNEVGLAPLPDNENYAMALELYANGASHSKVARELRTSINNVKRYYNWLVINRYLEAPEEELSERERQVVDCIYKKKMSLNETAQHLGISVPNVVQRRNNALRKGYRPPEQE